MQADEFEHIFQNQVKRCEDVLITKAAEYASDVDRLHNFVVAAKLQGISQEAALGGFLTKHLVSIFDMIGKPTEDFPMAQWDEKITDAMNYLFLLKAIVQDNENKKTRINIMGGSGGGGAAYQSNTMGPKV